MKKSMIFGILAFFSMVALATLSAPRVSAATTIDYSRDCDKFAVVYCGTMTKSELLSKMKNGDGEHSATNIKNIFDQFGLSASRIENDQFVSGVVYQNGEVRVGSRIVATGARTYIRTMGNVSTSQMGSAQAALVHLNSNGEFEYAVMTPCGNPINAKPVVIPPKPVQRLTCDSLAATMTNRTQVTITNKVTASGGAVANSVRYNFSNGTVKNVTPNSTSSYTFDTPGSYTVTATVVGTVNGTQKEVTSSACDDNFKIAEKPSYQCDLLSKKYLGDRKYSFTANASAEGGATVRDITIDFGNNGASTTVANGASVSYTYTQTGTFIAKATANITLPNGNATSTTNENCTQTIVIEETPKELPVTGPTDMIGLFSGVSLLGGIGYRAWIARRFGNKL